MNILAGVFSYIMDKNGIKLVKIINNSPAKKVGLKLHDIITKINDESLKKYNSLDKMVSKFTTFSESEEVKLTVQRQEKSFNLLIKKEKIVDTVYPRYLPPNNSQTNLKEDEWNEIYKNLQRSLHSSSDISINLASKRFIEDKSLSNKIKELQNLQKDIRSLNQSILALKRQQDRYANIKY